MEQRQADLPSGTVAFLFSDVEGSTQRWERNRDAMREAIGLHDDLVRRAFSDGGGYVFKTIGDAFCAAFPTVPAAIASALKAQLAIEAADWSAVDGLKVRMAIHVGDADPRDGDYVGPAVNRTSRLLGIGYGGQVLLSGAAADLAQQQLPPDTTLRDLGEHRLKDLAQPEQVYQLTAPGLQQKFFPLRSLEALPNNLPLQLTEMIGRDADLEEIVRLLADKRALTLVGAGGIGKTRLALQAAADISERFTDGVWLAELGSLTDEKLVAESIAGIFDVAAQPDRPIAEAIATALRSRNALLILDNCEHLVSTTAKLAETLLRGCPHLRILATSREPLGFAGETVHSVPALSLPDDPRALASAADAVTYGAIALFVERAKSANTRFALTDANAATVAEICAHLDGIALAIELAAARVKALSLEQVASMLGERFRLLTGGRRTALPRQQTLHALFDWSHDLLSETERHVFRRMAVFAGGSTLEAAEVICVDDEIAQWDVVELLVSLVDKSLVVAGAAGDEQRYRLLETTRAYALERLAESGELERVCDAHAAWMDAYAAKALDVRTSTSLGTWIERNAPELDNARAALEWCLTERHDPALGARILLAFNDVIMR